MSDRFLLSIFFPCLVLCAAMVLCGIWAPEHTLPPAYFKTAATLFVVGLASFLTWFVKTLRALKRESP